MLEEKEIGKEIVLEEKEIGKEIVLEEKEIVLLSLFS